MIFFVDTLTDWVYRIAVDCPRHRLYIRFVLNNKDRWEPKIIGGPVPHGDILLDIKVVSNKCVVEIKNATQIDRITFTMMLFSSKNKMTIFALDETMSGKKYPHTFRLR